MSTKTSKISESKARKAELTQAIHDKKVKNKSKTIGFTNKLAIGLVAVMIMSLIMGFCLAILSILYQYTGALACFTICVTPLDTCLGIVLCRVVDKSRAENVGADGTGISYMLSQQSSIKDQVTASIYEASAYNDESMFTEAVDAFEDSPAI